MLLSLAATKEAARKGGQAVKCHKKNRDCRTGRVSRRERYMAARALIEAQGNLDTNIQPPYIKRDAMLIGLKI